MAWTYDSALQSPKDQVRFLIGDVSSSRQILADEEIVWLLGQEANIYRAAAAACDIAASRGSGRVTSKSVGGLSISYDADGYKKLAGKLRARGSGHQVPYVGGISQADKDAHRADTDNTQSAFTRDMHEQPGTLRPGVTDGDSQ